MTLTAVQKSTAARKLSTASIALVFVWLMSIVVAQYWLLTYENTGNIYPKVPACLPSDSELALSENMTSVLVFLHPKCVCSRATIQEFKNSVRGLENALDIQFVHFCPADKDAEWVYQSENWDRANSVPNAIQLIDFGGREAGRFGVFISGHVLAYNHEQTLIFNGGVTVSRGHEGSGTSAAGLRQAIVSGSFERDFPVFGCKILEEQEREAPQS